jgi:hypothetical protein
MISRNLLSFPFPPGARWRFGLPIAAGTMVSLAACGSGPGDTASPTVAPSSSAAVPSTIAGAPSASTSSGLATPDDSAASTAGGTTDGTPIRVTIGDSVLTGRLWDNATARDLIAQLPLTLTLSDLNNLEKIGRLPRELSTDGVPEGDDPVPQDIGYYAPWGNLVFYYGDVGYFSGIVRIGQFDGSMDVIANQTGDFRATVELAD